MDKIGRLQNVLEQHGVRVTEPRLSVLDLLARSESPLRAYDILEKMKTPEREVNPPTVYRALASLEEAGLIHRLESLNAYIFCHDHNKGHNPKDGGELFFAICDECGKVEEVERAFSPSLTEILRKQGFEPSHQVLEVHGHCVNCQK